MAVPVQLPTVARSETYAGITYHIEGELVPALQVELGDEPIYFEHHVLLWKDPQVEIDAKPLRGVLKRMVAKMPVLVTQAQGPGRIAFSRNGAGHVFPIHLRRGEAIDVREHQFLAATDAVDYTYNRVKGAASMLFGGTGFFVDTFSCREQEGVLWLHGYGNVFEATLEPGEQIDVEPGSWVYKDQSVQMQTNTQRLSTGLFGSAGRLFWNRFTGPGKVGIQSMYQHMPTGSDDQSRQEGAKGLKGFLNTFNALEGT